MKRVLAGCCLALCVSIGWPLHSVGAQDNPATVEFYKTRVQPVLQSNCYRCHGGMNHRGGLNMQSKAMMLKGGKHGTALVPGHPEQSLLVTSIVHGGPKDDPMAMPPKGKLSDVDIALVEQWIHAGAMMPESATGR